MTTEQVVDYMVNWLREKVAEAGAKGVVLGVSGGVDSAVAALIAKRAFPDKCMALILPCESDVSDRIDSQIFLEEFEIPYRVVDLDNVYSLMLTQFESYAKLNGAEGRLMRANIKPRLRMTALYYSAQFRNYLVLGTSNKSEIMVGYVTKHGDGGVDLHLLGDLLKHQVYELARYLQVPENIINKIPSGGLWEGQTDEGEMGLTYEQLDLYLATGKADADNKMRIDKMIAANEHKRKLPETAILPAEYPVKF